MESTITMPLKEYNKLKDRLDNLELSCKNGKKYVLTDEYTSYVFITDKEFQEIVLSNLNTEIIYISEENKRLLEENENLRKKKFLGLF